MLVLLEQYQISQFAKKALTRRGFLSRLPKHKLPTCNTKYKGQTKYVCFKSHYSKSSLTQTSSGQEMT